MTSSCDLTATQAFTPEACSSVRVLFAASHDQQEFEGVVLELTPGLIDTIRTVRNHVRAASVDHLLIDAEPAEWFPRGVDANLRVTEAQLVVGANDIRFQALSSIGRCWISTRNVGMDTLEAAYAKAMIRSRARQVA